MNENGRLIKLFAVVALIVGVILLISFWPKNDTPFACGVKPDKDYDKLGKVDYKQYKCLVKMEDKNALVVADKLSDKDKDAINKAAEKVYHVVYYLDTEKISADDLKTIKKELKYNSNSFKENVILAIGNVEEQNYSKDKSYKEGIVSNTDAIYNFLKEAKISKFAFDITGDKEYKNLGEVTYDQYKKLYDEKEPFALVLAQTTCSYCTSFKPIIDEYAGKNNVPVYIVEIDKLTDDERTALLASLSYFKDNNEWGTPLTLGIKDKAVVANIGGYTDKTEDIEQFFKTLGLK